MADSANLQVRPASQEEAGLFFAMKPEEDAALGCIGHVRMDFGRGGWEFWHTWHQRGPEEWNCQLFKQDGTVLYEMEVYQGEQQMADTPCLGQTEEMLLHM